ncbi:MULTISPECIES: hypothetical protein [Caulobacter]|jgi:hypothetical protein|uniref:Uncharacterized protein n=1 Tax=Caulobacter rhizosphaerae TaxID=2010972 RepID=A0ABU1N6E6_9CAUL|nr:MULTISPECIES: hypothetical protein [Caulobacter]MDR6533842.1 hypothetical protein [Caulobacter rhizosphaerae]GGL46566.1 hypothetical protein GCM10010983_49800 [Caulobacter rhizosphaerae]
MTTAAYTYKHRQERHVSLTRLSVILGNLGLWAGLIVGLAILAH